MKIHEYQAKEIFSRYSIPVTNETVCFTPEEVVAAATKFGLPVVVKAQEHAGGRGKAGVSALEVGKSRPVRLTGQQAGLEADGTGAKAAIVNDGFAGVNVRTLHRDPFLLHSRTRSSVDSLGA